MKTSWDVVSCVTVRGEGPGDVPDKCPGLENGMILASQGGRGLTGIYRVQAVRAMQDDVPGIQLLRTHLTHYTCLLVMRFSSYLPQEDTTDSGLARLVEK